MYRPPLSPGRLASEVGPRYNAVRSTIAISPRDAVELKKRQGVASKSSMPSAPPPSSAEDAIRRKADTILARDWSTKDPTEAELRRVITMARDECRKQEEESDRLLAKLQRLGREADAQLRDVHRRMSVVGRPLKGN